MNDLNVVGQAQHVDGGTAMKVGSGITVFSAVSTWLTDNADLIGVIAILIGTTIGVAGFIQNRRIVLAREKREQIEHEARMNRRATDLSGND
jgi:uncharacterized membrane-anchored protein